MTEFVLGQRWINSAQPELGLGTIIELGHRAVTVAFVAAEETRVFSTEDTPLTRVEFKVGDTIVTNDKESMIVKEVISEDSLFVYKAEDANKQIQTILEHQLDHFIQLVKPSERLFSHQIDKNQWFELRYQALMQSSRFAHSDGFGLSGSRTSLLPHQLYIAHEVGKRYQPRVLLADEVGLGKTIEAGMILQQQILRGEVNRVLVLLPEPLLHQWLVEMLRRFNLHFSLYDKERFADSLESEPDINPFLHSQRVLCSLDFALENELHQKAILNGEWDCLIVDEAHHLHWDEKNPGEDYQLVETLSKQIGSVLLLTATPEQLGKESHFARLRLLDGNRFSEYETFLEEEQSYKPIADIIECLLEDKILSKEQIEILNKNLNDDFVDSVKLLSDAKILEDEAKQSLIQRLLDQQGTGRLLFRNTRASVGGFPQRIVHSYPLTQSSEYTDEQLSSPTPEYDLDSWSNHDPRVEWLLEFLKQHTTEKILLITAHAHTTLDLSEYIRVKSGANIPVFHEGMTILERDRAAAFFADEEDGCQMLICSEIGGEGRNFQFAKHLILFDLPINPDLLEQRIGRIDRIGQGSEIHLHVPYIEHSAQSVLYQWYYEGLKALQAPCPAGASIFREFKNSLDKAIQTKSIDTLEIQTVHERTEAITEQLHDGRDKLLELNSFRKDVAETLVKQLSDTENQQELIDYMKLVYDCYGVDCEVHSDNAYVLQPAETMVEVFPGLPDEGTTITFDRETALKYETYQFLTWEHDMVVSITDSILLNERGNTAVITFSDPVVKEGLLLVECLFTLEVNQSVKPYLNSNIVRVVIGEDIRDYTKALGHEKINLTKEFVKRELAKQIVKAKQKELEKLIKISQQQANKQRDALITESMENMKNILGSEINRLESLAKINPNVREEEINHFHQRLESTQNNLESANLRLDAVRVIVAT